MNKDNRIVLFEHENVGLGENRNYALDRTNGELVCFVDCDDIISKNYVEALVYAIGNDGDMGSVGCKESFFRTRPRAKKNLTRRKVDKIEAISYLSRFPLYGAGCAWGHIYRRSLLDGVRFGGFSFEDSIFNEEYATKANNFYFVDSLCYVNYINRTSLSKNKNVSQRTIDFKYNYIPSNYEYSYRLKKIDDYLYEVNMAWTYIIMCGMLDFLLDNNLSNDRVLYSKKVLVEAYPFYLKHKKLFVWYYRFLKSRYKKFLKRCSKVIDS